MIARTVIVVVMLGAVGLVGARASGPEAAVQRDRLTSLPLVIDRWEGREARPLTGDVVAQLGVDDYIHRSYVGPSGVPVGLYAGYYASQRQGDTIHSPQNCLPGAGWRPVSSTTIELPRGPQYDAASPGSSADRQLRVNKYVIQKGFDRQVVLYWYHGRGRVVANEFANKAWLMWDAATLRRTNGGLVRIISPELPGRDTTAEVTAFATALLPRLEKLMP